MNHQLSSKPGNQPKSGCHRFRAPFFFLFLAKQKKKRKELEETNTCLNRKAFSHTVVREDTNQGEWIMADAASIGSVPVGTAQQSDRLRFEVRMLCPSLNEILFRIDQGTAVLHHSNSKAQSGNQPKSGCHRFRAPFFVSFFGETKKEKKRA
jgi:hypothetical protein